MVRSSSCFDNPVNWAKLLDYFTFKVPFLVTMKAFLDTITNKPLIDESASNCLGRLILIVGLATAWVNLTYTSVMTRTFSSRLITWLQYSVGHCQNIREAMRNHGSDRCTHRTPATSFAILGHISRYIWPITSTLKQWQCPISILMTHLILDTLQKILFKSFWKQKLSGMNAVLIWSLIQNTVLLRKLTPRLHQSTELWRGSTPRTLLNVRDCQILLSVNLYRASRTLYFMILSILVNAPYPGHRYGLSIIMLN